jgi:TPP-dependent pyruvate/acetoin dehydrogenase alpha subunit
MTTSEREYREMYRVMRRIRAFENAAAELWEAGEIHGELHLANGHEAVAAGI